MVQPGKGKSGTAPGLDDIVAQDLKTGKFRPVYVLAGEDSLRIEGVVAKIRKDALGPAGAFNDHVFDGEQVPFSRILQQALSLPMLGGRQVVYVKHAGGVLDRQENADHLEKYLGNPVPETILILTTPKADRRKKWVKICLEAGYFFEFTAPTGESLIQWILKAAGRLGLPLDRDQAQLLGDLLGDDLLSIKNELDKLALLFEDRGEALTVAELNAVIMDQAELKGYEITEFLQPGRAGDVLKTWYRLAEWGRSPYEIAPLVLNRIRRGYLLQHAKSEGMADQEIGALTGQSPWSFRYLSSMIENMGVRGMARWQIEALECDRQMKNSPLREGAVFEQAILRLCREDGGS
ncbi:MAG: DNA polymerase III subunit delta [bacterium]